MQTEVVVIGAGIAGTMTAYFLAKEGIPVVLCEKGRVGGEQSSRNWGWVRKQGRDPRELPAIIESLRIWESLEQEIEADIGWHQGGTVYLAEDDGDLAHFERWLGFAKDYQLDSRMLSPDEVDRQIGAEGRQWKGALYTPSDGRAEPEKAALAIAKAVERLGGVVLTECAVRTVEQAAGRVTGVVTEKGEITCQSVVCAAGAWSSLFSRNLGFGFPQLKVRSSVLRTEPTPLATESNVGSSAARRRPPSGGARTAAIRSAVRAAASSRSCPTQSGIFDPSFRRVRPSPTCVSGSTRPSSRNSFARGAGTETKSHPSRPTAFSTPLPTGRP